MGERLSVEKIDCESKWGTFDPVVARCLPVKRYGDSDYVRSDYICSDYISSDYIRKNEVSTIVPVRFNHIWS